MNGWMNDLPEVGTDQGRSTRSKSANSVSLMSRATIKVLTWGYFAVRTSSSDELKIWKGQRRRVHVRWQESMHIKPSSQQNAQWKYLIQKGTTKELTRDVSKAMLLCPPHSQMSPNSTSVRVTVLFSHTAVTLYGPPGSTGSRLTLQTPAVQSVTHTGEDLKRHWNHRVATIARQQLKSIILRYLHH